MHFTRTQRACKDVEIKMFGEYQDLYVQNNTLLLANVFENFRNMCLKLYELDPTKFLSAPGLAWQTALKKTKIKLYLLTDIAMFLMLMKDYDKNKESSYIQDWDVNIIYMDGTCRIK